MSRSIARPPLAVIVTWLIMAASGFAADALSSPELKEPAEPQDSSVPDFEWSGEGHTDGELVGMESLLHNPMDSCADAQPEWLRHLTFFSGIDGSKQPQDFGVNANLGLQAHGNTSFVLNEESGLGLQLGTGLVASQNAVQVYELLGEATDRVQSYTTAGLFQRTDSGFLWALAHDLLVEESYDRFVLSQWRGRVGYDTDEANQFGLTAQVRALDDSGAFNNAPVTLRTINQGSVYWRHVWESETQTTFWLGLAEGHGENNAVTGPAPAKDTVPLFGADFLAPLNDHWALYGETNLIMPADTGTVDAFLGFVWYPGGGAKLARRTAFAPVLPVASPTTVSVDLR